MVVLLRRLAIPLIMSFFLSGCADHSVRHLSSDVSMIKDGRSTRSDVQTYLGEPDSKRMVSGGQEEWIYQEEQRSSIQNVYVIGGLFSGHGYSSIVITFEGDLVIASEYRTSEKKDDTLSQ